jgi:proteasome lid subunit RPN8/RPN11
MGHVICSVKTGPNQSIVKLNLFNYFEKKSKVALNKYEKAVERNNEIILHFATHPRHGRCFLSPNRNLQPN